MSPLAPPYLDADDGIAASNEVLEVGKNETRIALRGTTGGATTQAKVLLRVEGKGDAEAYVRPQQTFLIIDDSGSMKVNDPDDVRISAAVDYVNQIRADDEIGLVQFADAALRLSPLTNDKSFLQGQLTSRFKHEGATNMHDATAVANGAMDPNRLDTHTHNYILLTDGCWNQGGNPQPEVNIAQSLGVRMFNIGLGTDTGNCWTGLDSRDLRDWADQTGGRYYAAPEAKDLYSIYKQIAKDIRDVAGIAPVGEPMVLVKIMGDIEVVPGTFAINGEVEGAIPDSPEKIEVGNKGLTLAWVQPVARLRVGEKMDITFAIQSYIKGDDIPVNDPHNSILNFIRPDSSSGSDFFPALRVDVYEPVGGPGPDPGPGTGPIKLPPEWIAAWDSLALPLFPFAIIAGAIALALILVKRRNRKRMDKALRELRMKEKAASRAKSGEETVSESKAPAVAEKSDAARAVSAAASTKVKQLAMKRAAAKKAAMRNVGQPPASSARTGRSDGK